MKFRLHLTGLLMVILSSPDLLASDWYVSPAGITGGEYTGDGTKGAPWRGFSKISWGDAGVKPGDTLTLAADAAYYETLEIKNGGRPGEPISIRCSISQRCMIDGQGRRHTGILGEDVTHVNIDGIVVKNHKNSGVRLNGKINQVVVREMDSHDNGAFGIALMANGKQVSQIILENNKVSNNGRPLKNINRYEGAGIFVTAGTNGLVSDVMVRNNVAFDNIGVAGIMIYPSFFGHKGGIAENITVVGNKAYGNGGSGIDFSKRVMDSRILDNHVWGNGTRVAGSGIHVGGIKDEYVERIEIAGNKASNQHFVKTDGAGILVDDFSVEVDVHDNQSFDNEGAGIKIHNCRDVTVRGNQLNRNGFGVLAPGANNYKVTGNRIVGNNRVGIRIYPFTEGASITKNYIADSPVGLQDDGIISSNEIMDNCFSSSNKLQVLSVHAKKIQRNNNIGTAEMQDSEQAAECSDSKNE